MNVFTPGGWGGQWQRTERRAVSDRPFSPDAVEATSRAQTNKPGGVEWAAYRVILVLVLVLVLVLARVQVEHKGVAEVLILPAGARTRTRTRPAGSARTHSFGVPNQSKCPQNGRMDRFLCTVLQITQYFGREYGRPLFLGCESRSPL